MRPLLALRAVNAEAAAAWLTAVLANDIRQTLILLVTEDGLPDPFLDPAPAWPVGAGEAADRVCDSAYHLGIALAARWARNTGTVLPSGGAGVKMLRDWAHARLLAAVAEGVESGRIGTREPGEPQEIGPWLGALGVAAVRYGLSAGLRLAGLGEEPSRN